MGRKIACSISLCGILIAGAGCMSSDGVHNFYPHANSDTFTLSGKDHHHKVLQVIRNDELSLVEDLDLFFMTERASRLNRWHSK